MALFNNGFIANALSCEALLVREWRHPSSDEEVQMSTSLSVIVLILSHIPRVPFFILKNYQILLIDILAYRIFFRLHRIVVSKFADRNQRHQIIAAAVYLS